MGDSFAKRQRQKKKQDKAREKLARRVDKDDEGGDVEVVLMEDIVDTRDVNRRGGHDPLQELADQLHADGESREAPPDTERAASRRARARRGG